MTAAAAAAAAAAARAARLEEEQMTPYSADDLNGWEFKIVRSANKSFKRSEYLREVLAEESRAGWELVEKFDNGRIRLKRPTAARANDAGSPIDPYRTTVGMSEAALGLLIALSILGVIAVILGVIVALVPGGRP